jgi:hypothetical protein
MLEYMFAGAGDALQLGMQQTFEKQQQQFERQQRNFVQVLALARA